MTPTSPTGRGRDVQGLSLESYFLNKFSYTCPCCDAGVSETIHHTLFECKAFSDERDAFLSALWSICPDAQSLSDEYRMRFLMGDALPREIENSLYRYLITISTLRLGILDE